MIDRMQHRQVRGMDGWIDKKKNYLVDLSSGDQTNAYLN